MPKKETVKKPDSEPKKTKKGRDEEGFIVLRPIPGGQFDLYMKKSKHRKTKKETKIPKNSNKLLEQIDKKELFDEAYGMDTENMTEVQLGKYVLEKGLNYALNVNIGRQIPRIEDGLKPVERRILYTMYLNKNYNGNADKVATVAGSVIAHFHPHGDLSLYDTIYRLGRRYAMQIPYIRAHGNYGSMTDAKPAAPRYASASLMPYSMDCFFSEMGARYPIFEVTDNYHYSEKEPIYLTSRYPNILMQWNQGIGKGAAAWLGAFNSKDVFDATLKLMDDPNAKINIYPDVQMPVDIINKKELKGCFDMKKFSVKMRAQYKIVADKKRDANGKVIDKFCIVFTSLPINVIGKTVKKEIQQIKEDDAKLPSGEKKLPEVINIEMDPNANTLGGIEFTIEYEKGYDPIALAEKLFRMTSLAVTAGVQYTLVVDNKLETFTPRQVLNYWIDQRYDQKRRFYHQMALKCAKDRAILEAKCTLLEANAIDKAIKIIRASANDDDAIGELMKVFGFTQFQAYWVLRIELRTLNHANIRDLREQRDRTIADYKRYRKLLSDETAIKDAVRDDLIEGRKKYAKDRIAPIFDLGDLSSQADPDEEKTIYWNSTTFYSVQSDTDRKAIRGQLDKSMHGLHIKNSDRILVISTRGEPKVLDGFAFGSTTAGINFSQVAHLEVAALIKLDKNIDALAMVTGAGFGKIVPMADIISNIKSRMINLNDGDKLVAAIPLTKKANGMICMIHGEELHCARVSDFPVLKRSAAGNRIAKVDNGYFTGACHVPEADNLVYYGEFGYAKVIPTTIMKFPKSKKCCVLKLGKDVFGALPLSNNGGMLNYDDELGTEEVKLAVDKMVHLISGKNETKFRIGTSISSAVKLFKIGRNEFYQLSIK